MMCHLESPHEDARLQNLTNKQNYTAQVLSKIFEPEDAE